MIITFFFTELGQSGGPLIHYAFMNGLIDKGHDIYVVTRNESFRWYKDAHLDKIRVPWPKNKKISLDRVVRFIRFQTKRWFRKNASPFKIRDEISDISRSLIKRYNDLSIDSDVFVASHTCTADAVFKLGVNKKIAMYNMHFEEINHEDPLDRAEIRALNYLPFHHISLSTWLCDMFKSEYNTISTLITPGIDDATFTPHNDIGTKFKNIKTIKLISYCDPDRKFKGFHQQIATLSRLHKLNKNIEISIYGKDPKTNMFPYKFLGWVSHSKLAKYYSESHILLSFSWYESFPLPPIEAMACGCTVVAGRYGTEDYLIDDETGVVINPYMIEENVRKITDLMHQPEKMEMLASNGHKMAGSFNWKNQIDKLCVLLENIPETCHLDIGSIQSGNLDELNKIHG